MSKNIGSLVADLILEHKDVNAPLVFQQFNALERQYRQEHGAYTSQEDRLKQETFAYLIVKGNLEKGLYRK